VARNDDEGRAAEFWRRMRAAFQDAGGSIADAYGELRGSIHQWHVTKVCVTLVKKTTGSDGSPTEAWEELYGTSPLSATFQSAVEDLLGDSIMEFGEAILQFSHGMPDVLLLTRRFLPGEEAELDRLVA